MLDEMFRRFANLWRAVCQKWGSETTRRNLWNSEYAVGRWRHCDATVGDCVYDVIERYANRGDILDLGAGSGNTATELDADAYSSYTGIELSDVAVADARRRSTAAQRGRKNCYICADITSYVPEKAYDVVLFRDSIYYIPLRRIRETLERYGTFLKTAGVIIVRFYNAHDARKIVQVVEQNFCVVERNAAGDATTLVLVFRPR